MVTVFSNSKNSAFFVSYFIKIELKIWPKGNCIKIVCEKSSRFQPENNITRQREVGFGIP